MPLRDRKRCSRGGAPGSLLETLASGEQRGQRRGMGAPRAVGRRNLMPLDPHLEMAEAVEEVIDRLAVAAGDDHRRRSESVDPLGQLALRSLARELLCLGKVGGDDRGQREEQADQRLDRVLLEQPRPGARDHHRIDDERTGMRREHIRHDLDQRSREQHPRLGRVGAEVVEHRFQLGAHELGRKLVDGVHADGVLGGQRDDRAHPVGARGREGLQVGLDAGASAGVRARDRETSRHH
jgi:hypothetical protein